MVAHPLLIKAVKGKFKPQEPVVRKVTEIVEVEKRLQTMYPKLNWVERLVAMAAGIVVSFLLVWVLKYFQIW